ncbi:hypothetical protein [Campylobacter mucosalis]|uniref:hypothetical protein n=1 Tax=Campylobacter mucosalis TaxID=202 RepID=UPI0014700222|nr:hypothetical protein [Campylobacter mucosalis]
MDININTELQRPSIDNQYYEFVRFYGYNKKCLMLLREYIAEVIGKENEERLWRIVDRHLQMEIKNERD